MQDDLDVTSFEDATAVTPSRPGRFVTNLNPGWTINGKLNGGYLLAVMGRAVLATGGPHPHIVAATTLFSSSPRPGPVVVEIEDLRTGRTSSQFRARMSSGEDVLVEALFVTSTLPAGSEPDWVGPGHDRPVFDNQSRMPNVGPGGFAVAIADQVELHLDDEHSGAGLPSGQGIVQGSLALLGQDGFDCLSLLFAADAFPPATFDIRPTGWAPTLQLNVYVRALPEPGPVRVRQQVRLVQGQLFDEVCTVWDSAGHLVVQASQLAGIRF